MEIDIYFYSYSIYLLYESNYYFAYSNTILFIFV